MIILEKNSYIGCNKYLVELEGEEWNYTNLALITTADNGVTPELQKCETYNKYDLANLDDVHHFGGDVCTWERNGKQFAEINVYID